MRMRWTAIHVGICLQKLKHQPKHAAIHLRINSPTKCGLQLVSLSTAAVASSILRRAWLALLCSTWAAPWSPSRYKRGICNDGRFSRGKESDTSGLCMQEAAEYTFGTCTPFSNTLKLKAQPWPCHASSVHLLPWLPAISAGGITVGISECPCQKNLRTFRRAKPPRNAFVNPPTKTSSSIPGGYRRKGKQQIRPRQEGHRRRFSARMS